MHYLIHGQNLLDAEERVNRLRQELDPSGFGTSVIDATRATISDVQSALQAAPFFGGTRLVVLRGPATLSTRAGASDDEGDDEEAAHEAASGRKLEWRDVVGLLPSTPASTVLLFWISGTAPSTHAVAKAARDNSWKVEVYRIPRGAELMAWVSNRATLEDATIAPDAVEHLLDLLYPTLWRGEGRWETGTIDMRLIATEIAKLACAGAAGAIDHRLVDELIADRGGYAAFKLADQLFSGQREGALVELEHMLEAGEPAERIVGQLASDISLRWAVATTRDMPPELIAGAQKTSAGRVTTARNRGAGANMPALAAAGQLLRDVDAAVKSGRTRDTTAAIVPLVLEMSSQFARGGTNRNRR